MNKGSCFCGRIKFEITSDVSHVYFCYCSTCRKLSGAVFSCVSRVLTAGFNIVEGKEHLCLYESSFKNTDTIAVFVTRQFLFS